MTSSTETDNACAMVGDDCKSELAENVEAIRGIPIFKDIPHEIVRLHAYTADRRRYRKGDLVFRQGDRCKSAYLILSGAVNLLMEKDGEAAPLQTLPAGEFFGYMALLAEFPWPLTSRAAEDAELLTVSREGFRKIWARFPEKCFSIVEKLVQMRMRRMAAHMEVLAASTADHKGVLGLTPFNM